MLIPANPDAPELWEHQVKAVEFITGKPGALLDMEMGTGKTAVAIEHIRCTQSRLTLIFAPLSVVNFVWADQFRQHTRRTVEVIVLGQEFKTVAAKVKHAELRIAMNGKRYPIVVVVNYEAVLSAAFTTWASGIAWDLLILDEAHKCKSETGKISKWIRGLADKTKRRLLLSGTPMPHSPLDIWAQYRIANKAVFGLSFHKFRTYYAELQHPGKVNARHRNVNPKARVVTGFKNQDRFRENFERIAYSVKMRDVLDLPPVRDIPIRVRLSDKTWAIYQDLQRNFRAWLESGEQVTVSNALTRLLRLQQVTSGFIVDEEGKSKSIESGWNGKDGALIEVLDILPPDEPVVVFGRFLWDLDTIVTVARLTGRLGWRYSGQVKQLEEWREQGGVIAMQIQTGGVGIDLTKAAHCVYYSVGLSLGDYLQSRARLDRSGQTRPVTYTHLLAAGTVDERIMQLLAEKREVVQAILESKNLGAANGTERRRASVSGRVPQRLGQRERHA